LHDARVHPPTKRKISLTAAIEEALPKKFGAA
jgi:hypothetical protein